MNSETDKVRDSQWKWIILSVLGFWIGYLVITFGVGFVTHTTIQSEVWQLTAWGFISSAGLVALSWFMMRNMKGPSTALDLKVRPSSLGRFSIGFLIGLASFGVHIGIISVFAGPVRFEWVSGVGIAAAAVYFTRFLATSCMEEIGFRGYTLQRLTTKMGPWPAVGITAVAFGLSHLSYGWSIHTIVFGVIPGGLLWGMSAIATRGIAVPIGLHAAWNFAGWTAGDRSEVGLLKMIVEEDSLNRIRSVGMASYLFVFGALTIGFWLAHRRKLDSSKCSEASSE